MIRFAGKQIRESVTAGWALTTGRRPPVDASDDKGSVWEGWWSLNYQELKSDDEPYHTIQSQTIKSQGCLRDL